MSLACADCGRPYDKGPDLVIPNDVWKAIEPENGILCPNCIHDRLVAAGFEKVPARFTSGPMACDDSVTERIFIDRALAAEAEVERLRLLSKSEAPLVRMVGGDE